MLVTSFPHNPTGACVDLAFMQRVVDFCREREMVVVHDFAYADVGFDGYRPPSILQADGAKDVAVELYSMTKSFSMAGWRSAFLLGRSEVVQALVKLKSYLDYGMFQPVQLAAMATINEAPDFPQEVCATYERRRNALISGLDSIGWHVPAPPGSMFVWSPIPEPYSELSVGGVLLDGRARLRRCPLPGRRLRGRRRGLRAVRGSSRTRSASPRACATSSAASPSWAEFCRAAFDDGHGAGHPRRAVMAALRGWNGGR